MNGFGMWQLLLIFAVLYFFVRPLLRGLLDGLVNQDIEASRFDTGSFATEVVGESHYQQNLLKLCGEKTPEGVEKYFEADLIAENANPHDPNAIRVDIQGLTVGYLSRQRALEWRKSNRSRGQRCIAVVRGGWDRGPEDNGYFGVWIDV